MLQGTECKPSTVLSLYHLGWCRLWMPFKERKSWIKILPEVVTKQIIESCCLIELWWLTTHWSPVIWMKWPWDFPKVRKLWWLTLMDTWTDFWVPERNSNVLSGVGSVKQPHGSGDSTLAIPLDYKPHSSEFQTRELRLSESVNSRSLTSVSTPSYIWFTREPV